MDFPTTSVLTTFPGSDEDPLSESGAWLSVGVRTDSATRARCRLLSNAAASPVSATVAGESVWATTYAADQEVYCSVPQLPATAGHGVVVWVRIQDEGTASAVAYQFGYTLGTGFRIFKMTGGGTFTQIGSTDSTVMGTGDSFGGNVIGTNLELWHKPVAGSWTQLVVGTDSVISGSGKIGIFLSAGSIADLDDFGGGEVSEQAESRKIQVVRSNMRW